MLSSLYVYYVDGRWTSLVHTIDRGVSRIKRRGVLYKGTGKFRGATPTFGHASALVVWPVKLNLAFARARTIIL